MASYQYEAPGSRETELAPGVTLHLRGLSIEASHHPQHLRAVMTGAIRKRKRGA
ncbi:MAG: hypothetical protein H7A53_05740 [Akkermansiaceae bacterium]|nr:hypothetical protein [Akkermansiaceae bacterium]